MMHDSLAVESGEQAGSVRTRSQSARRRPLLRQNREPEPENKLVPRAKSLDSSMTLSVSNAEAESVTTRPCKSRPPLRRPDQSASPECQKLQLSSPRPSLSSRQGSDEQQTCGPYGPYALYKASNSSRCSAEPLAMTAVDSDARSDGEDSDDSAGSEELLFGDLSPDQPRHHFVQDVFAFDQESGDVNSPVSGDSSCERTEQRPRSKSHEESALKHGLLNFLRHRKSDDHVPADESQEMTSRSHFTLPPGFSRFSRKQSQARSTKDEGNFEK